MIGVYHSGAAVEWGEQVLASACLGGEPSSSVFGNLYAARGGRALSGIRIRRVAGANGLGIGVLSGDGANGVSWRAPGALAAGSFVTVGLDEQVVIPGADPDQYVVVWRATADALLGSESVQLIEGFGNAVAPGDVSNADRAAGINLHSQVIVRNDGAVAWTALKAWIDPEHGAGAVSVGWMADSEDELLAAADDAPTGVTWEADTTEGGAQDAGAVAVGAWKRLWIRREVAEDGDASAARRVRVHLKAVHGAGDFEEVLFGVYRVEGVAFQGAYAVLGRDPLVGVDTPVWAG